MRLQRDQVEFDLLDSGCCGMAGSFGFDRDKYDLSKRIGELVLLPEVRAAKRDTLAGMHGYRVFEKFLYPEFRGKGLAAAMQRRFAERIPSGDDECFFGFIHHENVWSLKAALHDGRVGILSGYIFTAPGR